jgi:hypothetical protein
MEDWYIFCNTAEEEDWKTESTNLTVSGKEVGMVLQNEESLEPGNMNVELIIMVKKGFSIGNKSI